MTHGSRGGQIGGRVDRPGRLAADVGGHPGASGDRGDHLIAEMVDERLGLRRLRCGRRVGDDHGRGSRPAVDGRGGERDTRGGSYLRGKTVGGGVVTGRHPGRDQQGPVEPGAEPRGQCVERLPRGGVGRVVPRVGEGQAHREEGQCEEDQDQQCGHAGKDRVTLDRAAPAKPEAPGGRRRPALEESRDAQLVDGQAGEAEHRWQQRDRGQHHQHHRGDRPDGQAAHEGQLEDEEAEQRDDDRRTGEEHRPPGGRQGDGHRVARIPALGQEAAVAGDNEQGVVDPDAESDHGHDLGSEGRCGHHVREQVEDCEGDRDTEDRGDDGEAHRHHRPEGQQHDDDRGQDPEGFARTRLRSGDETDRLATERDLVAGRLVPLGGVHHRLDRRGRQVAGDLVEGDSDVGDVSAARHLGRSARRERAGDPRDMGERAEGRGQLPGAGLIGRVRERRRGRDDHLGRAPREPGELAVQDLLGLLGPAREVVGERAPRGLRQDVEDHQSEDPGQEHPSPVVVARPRQPGEDALLGRAGGRLDRPCRGPGCLLCGRHGIPPPRSVASG